MMTEEEAKSIGSSQAIISVWIGLLIAYLIMAYFSSSWEQEGILKGISWIIEIEFKLNLFIGVMIMLLSGHFFGKIAGKAIIIKRRNFGITGILCGLGVLFSTAIFSGWTGFFREGIDNINTPDDPFEDYILKPFYWITFFGLIPACVVGLWFGWRIKVKGEKNAN